MNPLNHSKLGVGLALPALACLLASCAVPTGAQYSAAKAAPPTSVSIAVQTWDSDDYASLNANDKGIRDFEKIYLPLRLIDQLDKTRGIHNASLATTPTPSADFMVSGNVIESNGRDLEIQVTMTRVDGAQVLSKSYAIEHKDARKPNVQATLDGMFRSMSSDIVATALRTNISLPEAKAKAYAENNQLTATPDISADAGEAAKIEQSAILKPITTPMLRRLPAMTPSYVEWQSISAPLVRDQNAAQSQKSMANLTQGLSLLAGATALTSQYQAGRAGNTAGIQQSQQLMSRATTTMIQASASADVAQNRINQIGRTLAAYKSQFAVGQQRTITVRVFGKLRTLTGSQSQILKQFREGVKADLNARATLTV